MAPAAPERAHTTSPDRLQAPSDSCNDLYEGIPPPLHEGDSPSLDVLIDWFKAHSNNCYEDNEEFYQNQDRDEEFDNWDWDRELSKFTDEITSHAGTEVTRPALVATADSVAGPRVNNANPNGRATCTFEGCGKTFGRAYDLSRHLKKHNPDCLHCQQCDYSTYRKDKLQDHQKRVHSPNPDSFHCQECDFETARKDNLQRHQRLRHRRII